MIFTLGGRNIVFDFLYGNYTVSIADAITAVPELPGKQYAEGKISIMILRNDKSISEKSLKMIGEYIEKRIDGIVYVGNDVIDLNLEPHDQIMSVLMNAIQNFLH